MNKTIKIKRGLDLPIAGSPVQAITESPAVKSVALLPDDYIGVKPHLLVAEGDRVQRGQALFRDREQQEILVTSPLAGVVSAICRGERRRIRAIVIEREGDDEITFTSWHRSALTTLAADSIREQLLNSGLWTAFRSRPFGRVPDPKRYPSAIYVTAMDTNPLAVDPHPLIQSALGDFQAGLDVVCRLTEGPVYVCTTKPLVLKESPQHQVRQEVFVGPHPAGLVGTHIHYLTPPRGDQAVWYINYQDILAIGRLFTTGVLHLERVVSLAGPMVRRPRLVRVPLGANLNAMLTDQLEGGRYRVVSGSVLSGRNATESGGFLGRYHWQVTVLDNNPPRRFLGWLAPGLHVFSASRLFLSKFLPKRSFRLTTALNGSPRAMVPIGSYENVMPLEVLITPLLKALLVGDTETAKSLGCLELEEEDLALCSFVCCSKYDFGAALRDTLNQIEKTG